MLDLDYKVYQIEFDWFINFCNRDAVINRVGSRLVEIERDDNSIYVKQVSLYYICG